MKKSNAFTMIELLIIVALIGVLAATVAPAFVRLQARARQSEAKQNLSAIYVAYQNYLSVNNTYPAGASITVGTINYNCIQVAGWEPKGRIRYNYNCSNIEAYSPPNPYDFSCTPPVMTQGTQRNFTVAACGNIDADTTVDEWTIDNSKQLKNVRDDTQL
jgi:type IV pilus assembly protein PilA